MAANRLQNLQNDFTKYLDKRGNDSGVSQISTLTGVARTAVVNFKEDSPTGRPFKDFYAVGELLREDGSAKLYQCKRKSTQLTYAVKQIAMSKLDDGGGLTLHDEITALRLLRGGPHIIVLFDVFESDPDNAYLVLEEMRGGNLLSRIVEKEVYTEREARQVCKGVFQAIDYCHKKHIAHRDIKPENILLMVRHYASGFQDVVSCFIPCS